jgi:hypothetical protein
VEEIATLVVVEGVAVGLIVGASVEGSSVVAGVGAIDFSVEEIATLVSKASWHRKTF